jgi:hypothetical protein
VEMRYFAGLDLGTAGEYTALAVLERPLLRADDPSGPRRPPYGLRHLHRFPVGTPYPEIIDNVVGLLGTPPLPGTDLVVDQTGVGRPAIALLEDGLRNRVTCSLWRVTMIMGPAAIRGPTSFHIPKTELVGTLQVLLQTRRLRIARGLPDAELLVHELENFKMKVVLSREETMEAWREGPQDDLIFAAGLAAWVGELTIPRPEEFAC